MNNKHRRLVMRKKNVKNNNNILKNFQYNRNLITGS